MADQDLNIKVVTTADTTGIRQTATELEQLKEKARQDVGAAALFAKIPPGGPPAKPPKPPLEPSETERIPAFIRGAAGLGAILETIAAIKAMAEEINKVTDLLDKQGELLVQNSKHMIEQTKFAQTDADILKIAEEGLKNIAAQHKIVEELQKKEISNTEKFQDLISKQQGLGAGHQALLDEQRAEALRNEQGARRAAIGAIRAAEQEKERQATLSSANAMQELNDKIAAQIKLREAAAKAGDVQGYVERGEAIKQYQKQLESATVAHQKQQQQIEKAVGAAAPAVQDVLKNEQAARQALAEGRGRDADMFTKSAEAFERGLDPAKRAELEKLKEAQKALEPTPRGPRAGVGESQALVDRMEANRKAFEAMQNAPPLLKPGEPGGGEVGTGGPSLIGPEAEAARKADMEKAKGQLTIAERSALEARQRLRGENRAGEIERQKRDTKGEEEKDPELKRINNELRKRGEKPITEAQKQNLELKQSIDDLGRKFDKYWG